MARTRTRKLKKNLRFWPPKYYAGLTLKQKIQRKKEIESHKTKHHWSNSRAYTPFKSDKFAKTKKKSSYTVEWNKRFPEAKSIEDRSKVTGVPKRFLKKSFNRGAAAWLTGHRPGASESQWGYARVSSFLLCGKTHYTTDSDLVREAKAASASARRWWNKTCKTVKW